MAGVRAPGHGGGSDSHRSTSCPSLLHTDALTGFQEFCTQQRARHARALQNRVQRIVNARIAQAQGGDLVLRPRGPEKDGWTFVGVRHDETEE